MKTFQEQLDENTSFTELQKELIQIEVKNFIEATLECTCDYPDSPDTMCDYCLLLAQIDKPNESRTSSDSQVQTNP